MRGLECVSGGEHVPVVESFPDELKPDRHAGGIEAAGKRNGGKPGQIGGNGANISEIHFERVGGFSALRERGFRRRRRKNQIDIGKGFFKFVADERADFLRAQVIRVVVAGGKHVSAEQNAAFDFFSEAFAAAFCKNINRVGRARATMRVADTVETREVGRGFRRGDNVISRNREINRRK